MRLFRVGVGAADAILLTGNVDDHEGVGDTDLGSLRGTEAREEGGPALRVVLAGGLQVSDEVGLVGEALWVGVVGRWFGGGFRPSQRT